MATEKEYDGNLYDQLTLCERLERAYKDQRFESELEIIRQEIKRKLYRPSPAEG